MSYRLIAVAAAAIALEGCASKPAQVVGPSEDLNIGIAKSCTFSPVQPAPGGNASATITMSNDGWCAVRMTDPSGQPFQLGLISQRPEHGTMLVQKLGGQTRLEYTPNPGFTGADAFTAALRPRSGADATVRVAVTVERGAGMPAVSAPASSGTQPASTGSSRSSSSRATTRRPAGR